MSQKNSFLPFFTLAAIFVQATIAIFISWSTLNCKLTPKTPELHEVSLMKVLYLHDPETCGRVYFYNYTAKLTKTVSRTTIIWPEKNYIAYSFRRKIQLWLALHVLWAAFNVAYITQGHRPCGFYTVLLPFTLTGVSLLIMDAVYTVMFLMDSKYTNTEEAIFEYIKSSKRQSLRWINRNPALFPFDKMALEDLAPEDTSWISLLFAFASCRGIVQWVINFWIVKDNYFSGLLFYQRCQVMKPEKLKGKNSQQAYAV